MSVTPEKRRLFMLAKLIMADREAIYTKRGSLGLKGLVKLIDRELNYTKLRKRVKYNVLQATD